MMKKLILILLTFFIAIPLNCEVLKTISIYFTDTPTYRITIRDFSHTAIDLTDLTIKFRLFENEDDYVTKKYVRDGGNNDINISMTNLNQTTNPGQAILAISKQNYQISVGAYYLYLDILDSEDTYLKTSNKYILNVYPNSETAKILEAYYGNSLSYKITIYDFNHDQFSNTGYTIYFRLCSSESNYLLGSYILDLPFTNYTQSGYTTGQAYITLSKANLMQTPGTYYLFLDKENAGKTYKITTNKYLYRVLK